MTQKRADMAALEVQTVSKLQDNKVCWVCGCRDNLHYHHVFFGTANRKCSDEDGMTVWLCGPHHNMSSAGVHFNKLLDNKLKQYAERVWLATYAKDSNEPIEDFIKRYGRNYLN